MRSVVQRRAARCRRLMEEKLRTRKSPRIERKSPRMSKFWKPPKVKDLVRLLHGA